MRRLLPALVILSGLAAAVGCSKHPTRAASPAAASPSPAPSSPAGVIRLFEWSWNNRDTLRPREILTDDFRFQFALGDSAGNQFRDQPMDRERLLLCLRHLFVGGGAQPPASSIRLVFDPVLSVQPDSRPGRDPTWHKQILTGVDLSIRWPASEYRVTGNARFFVVRGDSAAIPADLVARGFGPDSTRWWIQAWWDESLVGPAAVAGPWRSRGAEARGAGPGRVLPAVNRTWGDILAAYLASVAP
ncbi:MAG: hypothetical protein HZC42_15225 [Candidatus Eisenbacteria bacterium]|nr:hypothetical protein [Candidatus Eisenbacteria bacterium]